MKHHIAVIGFALSACIAVAAPTTVSADEEVDALDDMYQRAVRRAQGGRISDAINIFKELVNADSEWVSAVFNVSSLSEQIGSWADCVVYGQRYLYLAPLADDADRMRTRIARCARYGEFGATLSVPEVNAENATITVNGMAMGDGTMAPILLPPGTYQLGVTANRFNPHSEEVELPAEGAVERPITLTVELRYGGLTLASEIEGGTVTVDGEAVGSLPVTEPLRVLEGRRLVVIEHEDYHTWQRYIDIVDSRTANIRVNMLPSDYYIEDL